MKKKKYKKLYKQFISDAEKIYDLAPITSISDFALRLEMTVTEMDFDLITYIVAKEAYIMYGRQPNDKSKKVIKKIEKALRGYNVFDTVIGFKSLFAVNVAFTIKADFEKGDTFDEIVNKESFIGSLKSVIDNCANALVSSNPIYYDLIVDKFGFDS